MGDSRFPKEERLTRKKAIDDLFREGDSFSAFPLRVLFTHHTTPPARTQVLVSVPAQTFPKATDRNTLKRRIREGYRLNKGLLVASTPYSLAYIYIAREIMPSTAIHRAIQTSLQRLNRNEKKD